MLDTSKQNIPSFNPKSISSRVKQRLQHIVAPHVESYNYMLDFGLDEAVTDLLPLEMNLDDHYHLRLQVVSLEVNSPRKNNVADLTTPKEARESGTSYAGSLTANVQVEIEGASSASFTLPIKLGDLPIMVMSNKCHLKNMSVKQLQSLKEEANEVGGYFIVNGIERIVRLLQVQRRNFPLAIERSSYRNRGSAYSDKGVAMRCARLDQSSGTVTLHYLTNGGATIRFVLRKQEFLVPLVLIAKALGHLSDEEFFSRIVAGDSSNTFLITRLELLLRDFKEYNLHSMTDCLRYLGSMFRGSLPISSRTSDVDAGKLLIRRYIFVHTDIFSEKLDALILMARKLFAFAEGKCVADNADALCYHEILLPGHLITMYIKEKLEEGLLGARIVYLRDFRINRRKFDSDILDSRFHQRLLERLFGNIGPKISTFLSTGNIISSTGMDLMQVSGYTIVAERLNLLRYMSHFQSVHRGQYFTTMKTTTVRKLLPESWGFLCPAHTPDGSPCGLLNHLARDALCLCGPPGKQTPRAAEQGPVSVSTKFKLSRELLSSRSHVQDVLTALGMVGVGLGNIIDGQSILSGTEYLPVSLDGVLIGGIYKHKSMQIVRSLRYFKSLSHSEKNERDAFILEPTMEIAFFPPADEANSLTGPFPGLYLFTQPGRLIRPVFNIQSNEIEWIGPMEQIYMHIACLAEDFRNFDCNDSNIGITHIEISPTTMLSHVAALTPYSDYNQSPRNMYQCQMGKQTMGTPAHTIKYRVDNKLFRIQHVQAPLVQTNAHADYNMDENPQGCNAVVAVISFTGYDMEDAMIINKGAFERGFGHGCVYKTHFYDLDEEEKRFMSPVYRPNFRFGNYVIASNLTMGLKDIGTNTRLVPELDDDGFISQGCRVSFGDPILCLIDVNTCEHRIISHKDHESAYIEAIRIVGNTGNAPNSRGSCRRVSITMRYPRKPVIGDKFSSRHGQKGTLSVLWPQENMPFTESGLSPDVLINPHAFPSRMTIGMLVESMAGKAAAVHGIYTDATPFQHHEEKTVLDNIGDQLRSCGFNYYGSEPLYNGLTGVEMKAEIFIGVVYYQRLRHMVSDKSQVRSTGPVTSVTRQPVKGRKKHGGIRLGEMERDALLSHGVAFCLQDRLMHCSDSHLAYVCGKCGGLLSVYQLSKSNFDAGQNVITNVQNLHTCNLCATTDFVRPIMLPYVFRYLVNELAGMGIRVSISLSD